MWYTAASRPEMKPVLEKLAQYYKDGLIDPEFIVNDYDTEAELVTKEQLGAMFGIQWTGLMGTCLQSLYENSEDPDSLEWKVYPHTLRGRKRNLTHCI